ncbi:MAG TPA: glycosyltransferase [Chloroflexota bacterium]
MTRIVVCGALANKPANGGNAWTRLSWLLGFQRLGFDVSFVEQIAAASCVDESGRVVPFEASSNLAYFRGVTEQFGIAHAAALVCDANGPIYGMTHSELADLASDADLLFNISGHLQDPLRRRFRRSVFFDDDPGYTQFWWDQRSPGVRLDGYDYWYTIGENLGAPGCPIPSADIPWRSIRVPVTLDDWPVCIDGDRTRFSTVATWRGPYGPLHYHGTTYGLKVHEFRKIIQLPCRVPLQFELALDIHPSEVNDLAALKANRWRLVDPRQVAGGPEQFRRYVQTSGAECSVAQGMYVATRSGWFSDRTVRYLASGKPVLVQDTGFSQNYPVGDGLIAFRTIDEAVSGAERIAANYDHHAQAARALAERYFDARQVMTRLCDEIGIAA